MLFDKGYYDLSKSSPKITAKTSDEIKALQQMLIDNGYDLGKYGVDGKIGSYTRNAYAQYVQDHPDEALRNTIVDGKIGNATREAYRKYLNDYTNNKNTVEQVVPADVVSSDERILLQDFPTIEEVPEELMSLAMTDAISDRDRMLNRLTLYPEHLTNQVVGGMMGNRGNEVAAAVESANDIYKKALSSGNNQAINEARELRDNARAGLVTVPGRRGLTSAEKKQAMAILTELSGGKPFTEDVYRQLAAQQGRDADSFDYVGIGRAGYELSNKREDRDNSISEYDSKHGFSTIIDENGNSIVVNKQGKPLTKKQQIMRTDNRIYNDPNRGRMGSWSVRIKDGFIEIFDRFEATEAKEDIAKGKNYDSGYNEARASWKPGTTHKLVARIPVEEYQAFYDSVKSGKTKRG